MVKWHKIEITGNVVKDEESRPTLAKINKNKTLRSVHFGVVAVELINCKCGGIVRNEIW